MAACGTCGEQNPPSANFCLNCGAPLARAAPAPPSARKTVTVLFCDVADSTQLGERLDPEALRRVMSRWFETMRDVVERHGGIVEKFVGDAVMAVFGLPRVNEDDALRAVRAAAGMQAELAKLNEELAAMWGARLAIRIGINTGEVVAGDAGKGQALVTGDVVNTAKRLEQAAQGEEILLGPATKRLVENAVVVEARGALEVKGKSEPVAAWSLQEVIEGAPGYARRMDTRLVGRAGELATLERELATSVAAGECRLVTVLGPAGIGKSRLATELAGRVDAQVLTARCLPYGDGITFWPLAQLVRDGGGEAALFAALRDEPDAELVIRRISGALGTGPSTSAEETFWAVRRLLETLARQRPLVVCLEDVHWAAPMFLDLIEYVVGWSRDAPIMLLCLARPDLLEERPGWLAGPGTAVTLRPLSDEESETLLDELTAEWPLRADARDRVREAAEGNPLFVEQLVAMLAEEGGDPSLLTIPPTIQALLAARLDRLSGPERATLERASVLGKEFTRGGVLELTPEAERSGVGSMLFSLVRRELIQSDSTAIEGDDGFRFRHVLIRDAAYAGVPKELRAELHERAGEWLGDDEIVGYHFEQAYGYRAQLGPLDERARTLAVRAAEVLGRAGHRAFARDDMPAAASLLERSVSLAPDAPIELRQELCGALFSTGQVARAEAMLDEVIAAAAAQGDRRAEWFLLLQRASHRSVSNPDAVDELMAVAEQAARAFEELADDAGLARAWRQISSVHRLRCCFGLAEQASELALEHARRCGDTQEEARLVDELCTALLFGPTRADEAIERCEAMLGSAEAGSVLHANVFASLAGLRAMCGDFSVARLHSARARQIYSEFGLRFALAGLSQVSAAVELLDGHPEAAERDLLEGLEILGDLGAKGLQAAHLAHALLAQGRVSDAAPYVEIAVQASGERDVAAQVLWQSAKARLAAATGDLDGAIQAAQTALDLAAATDAVVMHADAALTLADVARSAGLSDDAAAATGIALRLFEQKGHRIGVRAANARLASRVPAH